MVHVDVATAVQVAHVPIVEDPSADDLPTEHSWVALVGAAAAEVVGHSRHERQMIREYRCGTAAAELVLIE